MEKKHALYVYGIVANSTLSIQAEGIHPAQKVRIFPYRAIGVLLSDVPLAEFSEAALAKHLKDLEWVRAKVWAHEKVLEEVLKQGTVIPMKFATLFLTESRLTHVLAKSYQAFRALLHHLEGFAEWGVKIYGETARLTDEVRRTNNRIQVLANQAQGQSAGVSYLLEKKLEVALAEEVDRERDARLTTIFQSLAAHASQKKWGELMPSELTGKKFPMLFNGIFLVANANQSFHEAVASLGQQIASYGWQVDKVGPFPPYSFVDVPAVEKEVHV